MTFGMKSAGDFRTRKATAKWRKPQRCLTSRTSSTGRPGVLRRRATASRTRPGARPRADVFLMDEPLSNLDAKLRLHMRTELQQLHSDTRDDDGVRHSRPEEAMTHLRPRGRDERRRPRTGGRTGTGVPTPRVAVRRGVHRRPRVISLRGSILRSDRGRRPTFLVPLEGTAGVRGRRTGTAGHSAREPVVS